MRKSLVYMIASLMVLGFVRIAPASDKLSSQDKDTIKDAMRNLQAVAAECRLARDHTENDRVQSMASKILGGDDKMIEQIHDLRKKYDMEFDTSPSNPDVKDRKNLDKMEGKKFDREFADTMVQQNEELLRIFKTGAKSENADVREYFDKKQDAIREHLDMAKKMQHDLKD